MSKISTKQENHNKATEDIMHILRGGFGVLGCKPTEDGKSVTEICNYHLSRCNCSIIGINDGGGAPAVSISEKLNQAPCEMSPQVRGLFEKMEGNFKVAGGWYLVQQQREWLQGRIEKIMSDSAGQPLKIMVAGVAGYAHFFSYMKILFDAAAKVNFPLCDINVDVIDRCLTPLLEIEYFCNQVKQSGRLLPYSANVGPLRIHFSLRNWLFISRMQEPLRQCQINPFCMSLLKDAPADFREKYDVVTEHFLTSMVEKNLDDITKIRQFYKQVIKSGGHLLVASGFPNASFYKKFIQIHCDAGFRPVPGTGVKVWDPFGLSRQHIHLLQSLPSELSSKAFVPLENAMEDYEKIQLQPKRRK